MRRLSPFTNSFPYAEYEAVLFESGGIAELS